MSVDILSTVHATALTLRNRTEALDTCAAEAATRAPTDSRPIAGEHAAGDREPETRPSETIARLRTARDLNRARVRRLIAKLRQLQSHPTKNGAAEPQESIDQYISRMLGHGAPRKSENPKNLDPASSRAKLAAMRELSQSNTKQLLDAHFRSQFIQLTISKGAVAPLAMLAGTGLLAMAQSSWPPAIYPAILCFSIAVVRGWQYFSAVAAPLRQRALVRRMGRLANSEPPASRSLHALGVGGSSSSGEKNTVAELLAELQTPADAPQKA